MARTDNLTNYLTDIASVIKEKKGDTSSIKASDFDTEIKNLPTGGGDIYDYFDKTPYENYNGSSNANAGVVYWTRGIIKMPPVTINKTSTTLQYAFYYFNGEEIEIKASEAKGIKTVNYMFYACSNLKRIIGFEKIDLSNVTTTNNMLRGCTYLEEIDLSRIDFNKVTQFNLMFYGTGTSLPSDQKTKVYVKDEEAQNFILGLTGTDRPATWSTDNVIIAGSEADTRSQQ